MFVKYGTIILIAVTYLTFYREEDFDIESQIEGKNVLITGASSGIGEQLAYEYAKLGANVFITARRDKHLQKVIVVCKAIGHKGSRHGYITADMEAYDEAAPQVIEAAVKFLGKLNYVILNHAILPEMERWEGTSDQLRNFQKSIDVNLISYVYLASEVLPHLQKTAGKIAVVSSMAGKMAFPYAGGYSTAKFALDGFFSSIRQEFKNHNENLTVTMCLLGWIGTESVINKIQASDTVPYKPGSTSDMGDTTETALAIITATALGQRELYYPPFFGLRLFRQLIPVLRHL